jgi:hypothetical protein
MVFPCGAGVGVGVGDCAVDVGVLRIGVAVGDGIGRQLIKVRERTITRRKWVIELLMVPLHVYAWVVRLISIFLHAIFPFDLLYIQISNLIWIKPLICYNSDT